MKRIVRRSLLAAILACSLGRAAQADATADVQSKVAGAMLGAKSFVVTTRYPAQSYASTLVYVAPDRSHVAVAVAATTTDIVIIGPTSYSSKNGAPFEKTAVTPDESTRMAATTSVKVVALRPDVTVGGVRYGAFDTTVPLGALLTVTCTYDKRSFRLARCANTDVTQLYSRYDSPSNVVEVPADVDASGEVK